MPPAVSTSQIRMSRVVPSAWPLSQGSSAQGIRSIVTRTSRIVMSGLAELIGRFPSASCRWPGLCDELTSPPAACPARSCNRVRRLVRSLLCGGNFEHQAGGGGVRQQAALAVGDARFGGRGAAADMQGAALGADLSL